MDIIIIVGMTKKRVIGKDGGLPWSRIKGDLPLFKELTMGFPVVMGSKTYKSIGKPLSGRINVVLTRGDEIDGVECFNSIQELISSDLKKQEKIFIIGGANIYKQFLDIGVVDYIYLSLIKEDYPGNTFFPEFEKDYEKISQEDKGEFDFIIYKRKK